jgi:predicted aspartyl protease
LVASLSGKAIRLPFVLSTANAHIRDIPENHLLILDTGADNTALTKEFLTRSGYVRYQRSGQKKSTATGEVELLTCEVNGLILANQFKFGKMKVDVLENWKAHTVVGVIGMDILSRLTFILSHEHKKFLLSAKPISELAKLFA